MDDTVKIIYPKSLKSYFIKCLVIAASITLSTPVLANVKQDVIDDCYKKIVLNDYDSAFILCTKSAEQGNVNSQFNLGWLYSEGKGTAKDDKQLVYWHTKAAEQGHVDAQYFLGVMYDNGEVMPADDKQAIYWYTKAAEQGDEYAQGSLAFKHYFGQGTLKDSVVAYAWLNVAAAQGNENAVKGRGYMEEEMTPKQIAEAQKLSIKFYSKYVK
jgi:TPR repeat protein